MHNGIEQVSTWIMGGGELQYSVGTRRLAMLQNRLGGRGVCEQYTITEWTHPCAPGVPPCTRFTLTAARERCLSMPEIGEKERDYLFKKLYRFRVMT